MKYIVTFKDDQGKLYIKDQIFDGLLTAEDYADTVDSSREPTITPYIKMHPGKNRGEFTVNDHGEMVEMLEEVRRLFLFSYESFGCDPIAQLHVMQAFNDMGNAVLTLKLAGEHQKKGEPR